MIIQEPGQFSVQINVCKCKINIATVSLSLSHTQLLCRKFGVIWLRKDVIQLKVTWYAIVICNRNVSIHQGETIFVQKAQQLHEELVCQRFILDYMKDIAYYKTTNKAEFTRDYIDFYYKLNWDWKNGSVVKSTLTAEKKKDLRSQSNSGHLQRLSIMTLFVIAYYH